MKEIMVNFLQEILKEITLVREYFGRDYYFVNYFLC